MPPSRLNSFEAFEQVVFTSALSTGSTIRFTNFDGQEVFRVGVFGQGETLPMVRVDKISDGDQVEIARGFLLGSFVTVEGNIDLEYGRVVEGTALALNCGNHIRPITMPNGKMELC